MLDDNGFSCFVQHQTATKYIHMYMQVLAENTVPPRHLLQSQSIIVAENINLRNHSGDMGKKAPAVLWCGVTDSLLQSVCVIKHEFFCLPM